ncbi:MAG: hypothetical protein JKY25_04295 [Robiginitomaculum sp.]|nr:hypothetical protein [Robiginitomaculum sp.]
MTYRTLDTDTTFGTRRADVSAPVRHLRARRRASAMRHRIGGVTFTGLGI